MSRLSPITETEKEMFLKYWEDPYYEGFSSWKKYLEISLEFFKKEEDSYANKIKKFDKTHGGKFYENERVIGGGFTLDGHEQYFEEVYSLSVSKGKVFPLILMGVYTDFESTLIGICKKIEKIKPEFGPFKGSKITECKDNYLCKHDFLNLKFSETLNILWNKIDIFRELRNVFTHDNPIDITRKNGPNKLTVVKSIQDISVNENNFVSFDNEKPLLDFIDACDGFISNLITEIANKIYK
jgi:hypothetical protein